MTKAGTATDVSSALERITRQMTSNLHLGEVLQAITDGLVDELDAAAAFIWLLEDGGEPRTLTLAGSAGLPPAAPDAVPAKVRWILEHRDHFCTNRLPTDGSVGPASWLLENGLRALGGFPLIFRQELLGAMAVFVRRAFSQPAFERLFLFAHQAAVAIQNARLFTRVEELSARLAAENSYLRDQVESEHNCGDLVGTSPAVRRVLDQIGKVAPTDSTVLIEGETGTGKELVALAIHRRSRRRDRPMVTINCGAISAGLVGSELFGHERAPSPAPSSAARDASRWPTAALSSSTRWASCRSRLR
jgi:transcriptional regulator with GAF, ATPase, and Fis domain